MQHDVVWVLVADGQRARVLEQQSANDRWHELEEAEEVFNAPAHLLGTERPGRVHESFGTARHAIEPRQDLHEARKLAFARHLAKRLEAAAKAQRYARLIIVAPPAFLGHLREVLGEAARQRLRGSLDLDLTKAPLAEIIDHLPDYRPA